MQDPVLAKSFSRNERKRFGYGGLVLILIIILSCMVFKPHLHPLFMIGEVMNLQLSITATTQDLLVLNDTTFPRAMAKEEKEVKPICNLLEARSDYCEMKGDIRVVGNSSKIFLVTHDDLSGRTANSSWTLRPYPRKDSAAAMAQVKNWTVKLVQETAEIPKCGAFHGYPAVLFSQGGFSGNHFHDFTDLLVPIFAASQHFNGDVHFLATDYRKWWTGKYRMLLGRLSKHQVTEIDNDNVVQCFPSITVGLKCHKELGIDSSKFPNKVSMKHFKTFLRTTFSLPRTQSISLGNAEDSGSPRRPRLMMISRKKTRMVMNEDEVLEMAEKLGYEVVKAEASISTNLSTFAGVVNSCDVLMGVHGAGLTNMVFLPDNGVVIQVIPLGEIDGFGMRDFGYPSAYLNVKYLEYKIGVNESSLVDSYPLDDAVFKDPQSIHRKGWTVLRSIYLDQQNVRIDVNRFRATLVQALTLLQH
ncbi:PREDICTED: uncharacterized protein LOC109163046 [Ipomoea nil]|uniref:uncharacterized protein LOC109163046 n=1 Tax=Ipomoea nil TaxID=35883 RepID=UPI000901A053|nr:PREDICTED: uncharacterized protein LOC109163046 [Ipomoea nil]